MKNDTSSRYKVTKGPLMTMRTSVVTVLFLAAALSASSGAEKERMNRIESRLRSIINKAGIDFSGTFRSQYLSSTLDENSGDSAINWGEKQTETNEFTSVDFDIKARPNDALTGRLIFRMHQNWQNIWSDISNPIFSRWISIDGNVQDMFRFNVGDFRQKYSPLTLWSPDIDIAYEPEIFAARRQEAMKEEFLGNNDRLLQGVNFNLDAEVVPIFNEFHLNMLGARLRLEGANNTNGNAVADAIEQSHMDRYLTGGNLDLIALKGLGFGGTVFGIFDLVPTYNGEIIQAPDDTMSLAEARLIARSALVYSGRLNPTTAIFMDSDALTIGLNLEVAGSSTRDSAWYTGSDSTFASLESTRKNGMAIDAGISGEINIGEQTSINVAVGFMKNDSGFHNEMAQSPTFLPQRIMNSENDGLNGTLYSTFDALYHNVFKFAAASEPPGANSWTKMPRRKISYNRGILTIHEVDSLAADTTVPFDYDPTVQTVLPFGAATPNRVGPKGDLNVSLFDGGVDIGGTFAILSEAEAVDSGAGKTSFTKVGGGLCLDIATWVKPLNKCKLSLGYSMENAKNDGIESNNGFLNLGLTYNFWKRFSLLGGYQQITNQMKLGSIESEQVQSQWAAGLEYRVGEASVVTGRFGQIAVEKDNTDYSFKQWQHEIYLTVDF